MRLTLTRRDLCKSALVAGGALRLRAGETQGFKLGIITDELTGKLEEALPFISSYHLRWCELRELWGKNIMNLAKEDLDRAKKLIEKYDLQVADIGSPIFKWNLPQMPAHPGEQRDTFKASFVEDDANRLLDESFRLARFFGTPKVRIFSYWRVEEPEKAYRFVRDRLAQAAQVAAKNEM